MNRREVLLSLVGGLSASLLRAPQTSLGATKGKKTGMGVCIYCLGLRDKAERAAGRQGIADPLDFLEYCHGMGAGGVQVPIGVRDEAYTSKLRSRAEDLGMFIEGIMGLPQSARDVERFDAQIQTAKQAGAEVVRVVIIPGRRYERFDSVEEFRDFARRGEKSLELAEPVAARHRVRLAVENHKDQRIPERLEVLRRIDSEYVGACVDTGNSFALLEDPVEVVEAYASRAFSVHLKDQAVAEYEDGFLFADVPLGEGFLDLKRMVEILRTANPQVHFTLEVITRDPLKVPCLAEKYWATFADVPARELARTLRTVRANTADRLPEVSRLPLDGQAALEETHVKKCLAYAGEQLGL